MRLYNQERKKENPCRGDREKNTPIRTGPAPKITPDGGDPIRRYGNPTEKNYRFFVAAFFLAGAFFFAGAFLAAAFFLAGAFFLAAFFLAGAFFLVANALTPFQNRCDSKPQ